MSRQKEVLREIVRVVSRNGPFRIAEWFTEDFRLVEPTKPNCGGDVRAPASCSSFSGRSPLLCNSSRDMVEEADRVAVRWATVRDPTRAISISHRWRSTASRTGASPRTGASLFGENGLISQRSRIRPVDRVGENR